MTTLPALLVLLFAAALFAGVLLLLPPDAVTPDPTPELVGRHRAAEVATVLPRRPEGRQALKAEIAKAEDVDVLFVPAAWEVPPEPRFKPTVPRWNVADEWHTGEFEVAWQDFFGQEPDNLAVSRPWAGAGVS